MQEPYAQDAYFIDAHTALNTAKQNNIFETIPGHPIKALQLCYYTADIPLENAPKNCIHVPFENIYDYFISTKNRLPKEVSFINSNYRGEQRNSIASIISELLDKAKQERFKIAEDLARKIQKQVPDFNDEKLRVFIPSIRESTVLKHVAKNISETFKDLDYEVLFYIADELGNQNPLPKVRAHYEFNPHIVITIDFIENTYIHDSVFNFSWIHDPMPYLYDKAPLNLRKRDYIFTLLNEYKDALIKKGVSEKVIISQNFSTNPKIFFKDNTIKKENKIVFLGSDYNFEKRYNVSTELIDILYSHIENNELTKFLVEKYSKMYGIAYNILSVWVIPSLVRRRVIIWLCSLKDIEVEVYGEKGWLNNPEVVPFYKGLLPYGEEMAHVYNSAKYAMAVHPKFMYQQRVIEISACGTIPIIYNAPLIEEEFLHYDNVLTFGSFDELKKCIDKKPKKDPIQISEDISYKKMVTKIIDIVNNDLKEEQNV